MDKNYLLSKYSKNPHKVAAVLMLSFDVKLTLRLRFALYFRYSIFIEADLSIPSFFVYFCTFFVKQPLPVYLKLNPNNAYSMTKIWFRQLI